MPGQFGVGSVLGVEPVIHLIEAHLRSSGSVVLSEEIVNAYNSVSRHEIYKELLAMRSPLARFFQWAYGGATRLVVRCKYGDITVQRSSQGVRQGDPLAGLLFSYGMKRAMESLARRIKLVDKMVQIIAYLDNLYILTKSHTLSKAKTSLAAVFKPSFSTMTFRSAAVFRFARKARKSS